MAGLDDVALEGLLLGAHGLGFGPDQRLPAGIGGPGAAVDAATWIEARRIYRWFMPLLHLDAEHDLVQSIKLAEQIMGRGLGAGPRCRACRWPALAAPR
jgi:dihydrodipicolinate synthase/N-acetylneuraminate lyase